MSRTSTIRLLCLAGAALWAGTAGAAEHGGLWLGSATLNAVSQATGAEPDLSFDLQLAALAAERTLVPRAAGGWQYDDRGLDQGTVWREGGAPPAGWKTGAAPLARPAPPQGTALADAATAYFRHSFQLTEAAPSDTYSQVRLRLWRDDGVVVYLNGAEVLRNNVDSVLENVPFGARALSEVADAGYVEVSLSAGYLRPGSNWVAVQLHRAAPAGGQADPDLSFDLELLAVPKTPPEAELVASEADGWRYASPANPAYDPGVAGSQPYTSPPDVAGRAWFEAGYPDAVWATGQAQLGYGDEDERTLLPFGAGPLPRTVYFRKAFDLPAGIGLPTAGEVTHLRLGLARDDGAAVYVNGKEVFRSNLPTGALSYATAPLKALGATEENRYVVREVKLSDVAGLVLHPNGNVVAAEVHQHPSELRSLGAAVGAVTRTPASFPLRLLLHVAPQTGRVRLLKEVVQMVDSAAKEPVLVANADRLREFSGAALRDGTSVGVRVSAVGFDFGFQPGTGAPVTSIDCGPWTQAGPIQCPTVSLSPEYPTNPFLHRYHPDHDNWDARYEGPASEAYEVKRTIALRFSGRYPPNPDEPERSAPPGWGDSLLGGTYEEVLGGLHRRDVTVQGWFSLQRVSTVGRLEE